MVPSAGITRFRFEGSATRDGRPLSPADPSSPGCNCRPQATPALARAQLEMAGAIHSRRRDRARPSRRDRVEQLGSSHVVHRRRAHAARVRPGARARHARSQAIDFSLVLTSPRQRARMTCAFAGCEPEAADHRRPRRVELRRLRGSHHRGDPRRGAGMDDLPRRRRPEARRPTRSRRAPIACSRARSLRVAWSRCSPTATSSASSAHAGSASPRRRVRGSGSTPPR